jgi:hypothetical protein
MMNCTFDYFPAVLARSAKKRVEVDLEKAEMVISVNGKRVQDLRAISLDEKSMVLAELEAICHRSIKK